MRTMKAADRSTTDRGLIYQQAVNRYGDCDWPANGPDETDAPADVTPDLSCFDKETR